MPINRIQTFKVSFRIDEKQFRILDELLRQPENGYIKTISDALRYAVELVIVELSKNCSDPDMVNAARLAQIARKIQFKEDLQALEHEVNTKGPMYGFRNSNGR